MKRLISALILLVGTIACSNTPTAPSQPSKLTMNTGSVVMGVNSTYCFTATGGVQPYKWGWSFVELVGQTIAPSQPNGCVSAAGPGTFTVIVTSADGQTASAIAAVTR